MMRYSPAYLLLYLLLAGCTSVPFDHPKTESHAIPTSAETRLGGRLADWQEEFGKGNTAAIPLSQGLDALGTRLVLIDRAEASIDAQYFLLKPDDAGNLFLGKLLRAAERGVRVRLLIDDIFTPRNDRMLAIFNSHPNIEVRLFNPVSRASPKAWSFLWGFSRVNRRMHNKAFIVDGSVAVMGGRNIAAEYFELKPQQAFDDFEMLLYGEVIPEIADSFDHFWNSALSVPMEAVRVSDKPERRQRWLDYMDDVVTGKRPSPYAAAINSDFLQQILDGNITPYISTADLIYDAPRKLEVSRTRQKYRTVEQAVGERLRAAREEVIIITPYLVPRDLSFSLLRESRARGVRVIIVTNSLGSTNHVAVHSAYAPHRKAMLEAGAELYELKVDVPRIGNFSEAERVTLHTKAVIIDRQEVFVGSLNMDPRSIELNTEIGLFINSPEAAAELSDRVSAALPQYTYRLELDAAGRLRWHYHYGQEQATYSSEPDAGGWRRFKSGFYGLLPLDSQL